MGAFWRFLTVAFVFLWARNGLSLSYGALTRIIRDNHVRSIDELLPLLPERYRENYTFVYQSRSLQASAISPEWPRTILYGDDARLIMAFTKSSAIGLEDTLETIEFDESKAAFRFRSIPFAPGKDPLVPEPEINPAVCKSCHGQDPRPNWDAYNIWPGVYGSVSRNGCDTIQEGTTELRNYLAFMAGNRKRDRYQHLPMENVSPTACPLTIDHDYTFRNARGTTPNSKFTDQLYDLNARRIKRLVHQSPTFSTFKYLWAGLAQGCLHNVETFFPPHYAEDNQLADLDTTKRELAQMAQQEFSVRLASFVINNAGSQYEPVRVPVNFLNDGSHGQYTQLEPTALFKFVADRTRVSTNRWETAFSDGRWTFATPIKGPLDMFRNWAVPSVGYLKCDELAAKSVAALSVRR